ncbi:hypothetical protein BH23ACT11_BH23ACT11_16000 [soil metagenome]
MIALHDEEPPRIHTLPELLRRVVFYVPDLNMRDLQDAVNGLNQYYIPTRYPIEIGSPSGPITTQEASEALAWAEDIAAAIRPRLG